MYHSIHLFVSLIIVSTSSTSARTWKDIIEPSVLKIYDPNERMYTLEQDPFFFGTESPTKAPVTDSPTLSPSTMASEVPTIAHSAFPSIAPSLAPTGRWQLVDENGGCPVGEELHELRLHDSWGDGWHGSVLKITRLHTIISVADGETSEHNSTERNSTYTDYISLDEPTVPAQEGIDSLLDRNLTSNTTSPEDDADAEEAAELLVYEGSLDSGSDEYHYLCLETFKCYSVEVGGGDWEEEIKWEVRGVPLGLEPDFRRSKSEYTVAKGRAPAYCHFSVKDKDSGFEACPFECFDKNGILIDESMQQPAFKNVTGEVVDEEGGSLPIPEEPGETEQSTQSEATTSD